MELAELFLLVWAIGATIVAVVFKHLHHKEAFKNFLFEGALVMIAKGKAEAFFNKDGNLELKELKNGSYTTTTH